MRWCARKGGFTTIRERQNASRTIRFDSATNSIHVLASESLHGLRRHLSCVSSACYYVMTFSTSDPTFFFFFLPRFFGLCFLAAVWFLCKAKNTRAQYTIVKILLLLLLTQHTLTSSQIYQSIKRYLSINTRARDASQWTRKFYPPARTR